MLLQFSVKKNAHLINSSLFHNTVTLLLLLLYCFCFIFVSAGQKRNCSEVKTADQCMLCMYSNVECHCNTIFVFFIADHLRCHTLISFDVCCVPYCGMNRPSLRSNKREQPTTTKQKQRQRQ